MKMNVRFLCESAVVAALYAVLTWVLAPISYGPIQFRISEILVLLVFFNPKYAYAIILGCFVSNTTSSLGWYDMVFGTLATTLAVLPMIKTKRIGIASIYPVISNALIVSFELWLAFKEPGVFFFNVGTIALGEAVVLFGLGIPFYLGLSNNASMCELLEIDSSKIVNKRKFSIDKCLYVVFGVLSLIFYFALPISDGVTMMSVFNQHKLFIIFPVICVLSVVIGFILKGKLRMILEYVLLVLLFGLWITSGLLSFKDSSLFPGVYYFLFVLIIILNAVFIISTFKKEEIVDGVKEC
jgi:uncharacterized membrane protein